MFFPSFLSLSLSTDFEWTSHLAICQPDPLSHSYSVYLFLSLTLLLSSLYLSIFFPSLSLSFSISHSLTHSLYHPHPISLSLSPSLSLSLSLSVSLSSSCPSTAHQLVTSWHWNGPIINWKKRVGKKANYNFEPVLF